MIFPAPQRVFIPFDPSPALDPHAFFWIATLGSGEASQRPTFASTSALKNRSTTNMKAMDGISRIRAVIEAIW